MPASATNRCRQRISLLRPARILAWLLLLALPVIAACGEGGSAEPRDAAAQTDAGEQAVEDAVADAEMNAEAETAAASDSLAAPDSLAAADSTAVEPEQKRSWKDRLFGKGGDEDEDGEGGDDEDEEDPPVPVETALVGPRDIPSYLSSTATLEPEKEAQILAKTDGEIQSLRVEEGAWVKKGDLLAKLDGAAQEVALEEVAARAKGLKLELDRIHALFEQDLASEKDLNNAQAEYEQAEAARKAMGLNFAYTRIVAPYAGQISQRLADPGQNVTVGTHLFTIVDPDPLLASIHLPEREVVRLAPNQEVLIQPETEDELTLTGRVLRISPVVDSRTGTVKVTCGVDPGAAALRPGSFVRVKVQTGLHEEALSIPKRALVPEGGESFVYKAVADSVVRVEVSTGYTDDRFVEIVDGLVEGERIVTVGQGALKPGAKIRDLTAENDEHAAVGDSTLAGNTLP